MNDPEPGPSESARLRQLESLGAIQKRLEKLAEQSEDTVDDSEQGEAQPAEGAPETA